MKEKVLSFEVQDRVGVLTLNRPEVHNAVDEAIMAGLERVLPLIYANPELAVLVITGAGYKTFCSGGDLHYFDHLKTREQGKAMSLRMQTILDQLYHGRLPVIAMINGDAYGGGCELLTACHFRVARKGARFAFRQALNGVSTGWGGGVRLLRQLPRAVALRLLLTSIPLEVEEARTIGFIDEVVPEETLKASCMLLASQIAACSQIAVASFLELARVLERDGEVAARSLETDLFADTWVGQDFARTLKRFSKKSQTEVAVISPKPE